MENVVRSHSLASGAPAAANPGDVLVDALVKGFPPASADMTVADIGRQGWSLLDGDVPLPVAVLREERLRSNSAWMRAFAERNGLLIAPHGKTTMAPELFRLQLADGAWAITVATVQQLMVARRFRVKRVLLANQPIGRVAVDACFAALADDPDFELYCLVDSLAGVAGLAAGAARAQISQPLKVLVEIGIRGGRTGARTPAQALAAARAVAAAPGLALSGVEAFEGILPDAAAVHDFLATFVDSLQAINGERLFADGPVVISAGGSAFFDRVATAFKAIEFDRPLHRVLRSGCYLTHDAVAYDKAFNRVVAESGELLPQGRLEPALEVWSYVQSRPEPGLAILTAGRRDVGHDAGLPLPTLWHRPGQAGAPEPLAGGHRVTGLNDQHAYLALPATSPLEVGDMVALAISHPCTTFDKWRLIMLVDEDYRVTGAVSTYF